MGSTMTGTEALHVDHSAEMFYNQGRAAAQNGDIGKANDDFAAALRELENSVVTFDAGVQTARIGRNIGFSWVKAAIASNDTRLLNRGANQIARYATPLKEELQQDYNGLTAVARREAVAEYGAAVSFLGRTATATQVMRQDTGATSARIRQAAKRGSEAYTHAHTLLKEGGNGYHRVSNAITAARHERMNGRALRAAKWTGRAVVGLAWTAAKDRENFKVAALTAGNRSRDLLTRKGATRSVKTAP